MNLKSKLLNLSEIARRIDVNPQGFINRVNGFGRARPLSTEELTKVKILIEYDVFDFDDENIPVENIDPDTY